MRVFDSNILIYHLNDALPPSVFTQVESWIAEGAVTHSREWSTASMR
jgi:hypothetical protein